MNFGNHQYTLSDNNNNKKNQNESFNQISK